MSRVIAKQTGLGAALRHFQAGELALAEQALARILRRQANNVEALNLLGVVALEGGAHARAEQALHRAIELRPTLAGAHYNLGRLRAAQGRLDQAIACYRAAIGADPRFALAHNNLGNALRDRGEPAAALACYRQALAADPKLAAAHLNLGNAHLDLGRLDEAIACYQQALLLNWRYPKAHHNLGLALGRRGDLEGAGDAHAQAVALKPDYAEAHDALGAVRYRQGRANAALAAHERALALDPGYARAHLNRGNALLRLGRPEPAEEAFRRALALRPSYAEAHCNLGLLLLQRGSIAPALASLRAAIDHDPKLAAAQAGLGRALREQRELGAAVIACEQALALDPQCVDAQVVLGNIRTDQDRLREAAACYRRAVALDPARVVAHANLGQALQGLGQLDQALASLRRALALDPRYAPALTASAHVLQQICAWDEAAALAARLDALIDAALAGGKRVEEQPFAHLGRCSDPARNLAVARSWSDEIARQALSLGVAFEKRRPARARIRLGYLSGDFHDHPVAHHFLRALHRHDHGRFEVVGYAYGPDDGSASRREAIAACERFVDLDPMSDVDAARRIHQDEIDILVDLSGYMRGHRLRICALRPAPLQVSYFGFPGSTGATFFDYVVVDPVVVPRAQAIHYTEQLIHLPGTYQPNDYALAAPAEWPARRAHGLPDDAVVLASFNQPFKLDPTLFDVWMQVLAAVPESVLWLYAGNPTAEANLRQAAAARGIAPERLIAAPRLPLAQHLARLPLADLALDTRIYGGGCTTSNALWAGVPVITLQGDHFASRMGASVLSALGMSELIVESLDGYRALAVRLARDPRQLRAVRAKLAALRATSAVFDGGRVIRDLERAYDQIWQLWRAGEAPRPLVLAGA